MWPERHNCRVRGRRDRAARLPESQQGSKRLAGLVEKHRVAVVCGEESPARCHCRLLIAPALRRPGVEMRHIRADGRLQSEDELERAASGGQVSLEFAS